MTAVTDGPAPGRRALRILFLTHYYAPEIGAPQTRLRETAAGLRALGHDVRVVTGAPHYPDGVVRPGYSAMRPSRERIDGVQVLRLPVIARRNGGLLDRTIDQGSFAAAAVAAAGQVRWSDVVLVESPPLFLGLSAAILKAIAGRPYVFHVADPWPDFPIAMGALRNPFAQRAAFALETLAYRGATTVTTVTPGLVEHLDAKPAAHGKVRLVPNGVDVRRFDASLDPAAARATLGWPEERLTLVYAGSVGLAQGLGTLLEAVEPLAAEGVSVRILGEGFERDRLEAEATRRGLEHVRFEPGVPRDLVPAVLAAADGVLTLLRRGPLYEHSLPTKLLEGLAAGRPLVVSAAGEAARIVADTGAGVVAGPEDPLALRQAIRTLGSGDRRAMGRAARRVAETAYDRPAIVDRLATYLEEAVALGSARA